MQFRKYEFNTLQEWATLKNTLEFDINSNPRACSIVELGNVSLTKTAVDILWYDDIIPLEFTQYEVWPKNIGNHTFQGMEGLYKEEYNKRNQ